MNAEKHDPMASDLFKNFLADKRTILAYLRTGIAILTIPMSLITILIATSSQYEVSAMYFSMIVVFMAMMVVGVAMMAKAFWELRAVDKRLKELELEYPFLSRWESLCSGKKVSAEALAADLD